MSKKTKDKVLVNPNCEKAKINDYHRFTEKDYNGYKLSSLWCGGSGAEAVQKLGQLEDILEKYGIKSFNDLDKRLTALEIIKETGLSLLHKSLIISSKNYKEYIQEFQLVKSREFKNEHFYLQEEFDLLKEALL